MFFKKKDEKPPKAAGAPGAPSASVAPRPAPAPLTLEFKSGDAGVTALGDGWAAPEAWGVWSTASMAHIMIDPAAFPWSGRISGKIVLHGFVSPPDVRTQAAVLTANGGIVAEWAFNDGKPAQQTFEIPKAETPLVLALHIAHPTSPLSIGKSKDTRELGVGLRSLYLEPVV